MKKMSPTSKISKLYMTNSSIWLTFGEPIKDGHVGNHFCNIFIPLCHVGFFINCNGRKLMDRWICRTFYTSLSKIIIGWFGTVNLASFNCGRIKHISQSNQLEFFSLRKKGKKRCLSILIYLYMLLSIVQDLFILFHNLKSLS